MDTSIVADKTEVDQPFGSPSIAIAYSLPDSKSLRSSSGLYLRPVCMDPNWATDLASSRSPYAHRGPRRACAACRCCLRGADLPASIGDSSTRDQAINEGRSRVNRRGDEVGPQAGSRARPWLSIYSRRAS